MVFAQFSLGFRMVFARFYEVSASKGLFYSFIAYLLQAVIQAATQPFSPSNNKTRRSASSPTVTVLSPSPRAKAEACRGV